jgi:hypothetical protein
VSGTVWDVPDELTPAPVETTAISRWALARYLVGRVIGFYVSKWLLIATLVVAVLAALAWWLGPAWLGALVTGWALCILLFRWLVLVFLRHITAAGYYGPIEERMRALVWDTMGDVRTELKRIKLPSTPWTIPLLLLPLLIPSRRRELMLRLRAFEVSRAVSRERLDEAHLLVSQVVNPAP